MPGDTRTVTVVFTDLVGSTALSQRLEAKAADELRAKHFGSLTTEVEAVGGSVVKNLGDGLMVVFDTPTAALAAAVGMQQAVERHSRGAGEPLAIRIGIAIGEATASEGDFFGDPVVEAARLCAAAEGGQILATDVVRVVAGRHAGVEMTAVGELELKGMPEPVPTVEVGWSPAIDRSAIPLQARLAAGPQTFVGRSEELELLEDALKRVAATGQQELVLVGGEPGIGKTTLASVFARSVHDQASTVLYGRCDEDLGIPHQPWAEAVGHLVSNAPAGLLDDVTAVHGADLAHLSPALAHLGRAGGSADPETARYMLFGAVLRLLAAAGADRPVVLVIDDLQWADAPTLQLLRHWLGADQAVPVVLVATFRESEVTAGHRLAELLAWSHRQAGVTRLSLRGLGDTDLLALLEAGAGHALGDDGLALRDALERETDGNPFFVGEVLRHLVETGVVYQDPDGIWTTRGDLREHGLPVSVREVINQRVARLGEEAVRVLSVASVIGRDFDLGLLAATSSSAEDRLLDVLDAAVAATLVVNIAGERYSFNHALVARAIYDALTPARRIRAHRRVAEAIEGAEGGDLGSRVGELAYHWEAAGDVAKAISYATAAGDRALAQLAPAEGLRWYQQALSLLEKQSADDAQIRAVLLAGLGDAQRQTGDPAFRETLLAAARLAQTVGDTGTLVATALANNRGPMWTNLFQVDLERVAVLEAALSAGGEADGRQRALLLSHLALERLFGGSDQDHKAIADEALALARDLGDPVALLEVLLRRFDSAFIVGHLVERRAETAEAEELADHVGDPIARFWSASNRMTAAMQSADMAELTRCVDIQSELARQIGQPTLRWRAASSRCLRALLAGDAAVAEALAEEAFNIGTETGQPDAAILHGTLLGQIRWHRGVLGEHLDVVAAAADNNPQFPMVRAALARGYAEIDREDEARALLHAQAEAGFVVDHAVRVTEVLWAEVAGRVGDRSVAEKLYEGLATWPDRCAAGNAWVFYGAVDHYLGHLATVLGRYDVAEHHFTQALALHERLEAPFHVARTKLELGRMLMARGASGDIEAARAHLEEARDLAQRCGCALVEKRANDSLGQL